MFDNLTKEKKEKLIIEFSNKFMECYKNEIVRIDKIIEEISENEIPLTYTELFDWYEKNPETSKKLLESIMNKKEFDFDNYNFNQNLAKAYSKGIKNFIVENKENILKNFSYNFINENKLKNINFKKIDSLEELNLILKEKK